MRKTIGFTRKTFGFTLKTLDFTRETIDFTRKTLDFTRGTVMYDTNGLPYVVSPEIMRQHILHLGHYGLQKKINHLARFVVYWPHINSQVEDKWRCCTTMVGHWCHKSLFYE